jgi:nicotinamidase-related amidase
MQPFPLRPPSQALLVVDMQNDFVREGAPQEVPDARAILPALRRLVARFRAAGRPVIYTRFIAGPKRTLMWTWSPECGEELKSCWPGHFRKYLDGGDELEGPAVVNELRPQPDDRIIDKYGYGAFHNTNLLDTMRALGVAQLVVTGTVTQICVEETVREGFHEGLEMVVVRDGVASFDAQLHEATLKNLAMKFARIATADEVIALLDGERDEVAMAGTVG